MTGYSLLADVEMIRQIGPLDPDYFAYWEDVDLYTRAKRAGWEVMYSAGSVVWHKGGTVATPSPLVRYVCARNVLRYTARHHRRVLPITVAFWIFYHVIEPAMRRRFEQLPISISAVRDALLRRTSTARFPVRRDRA